MNKIIDILIWDITTNKRVYFLQAASVFAVMVTIMIWPTIFGADGYEKWAGYSIVGICTLINYIYFTLLSAPFDGKQKRISMLMLPATMQQKLVARLIFVAIIVPLSTFLLAILADAVHYVFVYLIGTVWNTHAASCTPYILHGMQIKYSEFPFTTLIENSNVSLAKSFNIWTIFYGIMCGAIWTRRALLKSIVLAFVIFFAYTILTILGAGILNTNIENVIMGIIWVSILFMAYKIYDTFVNRDLVGR